MVPCRDFLYPLFETISSEKHPEIHYFYAVQFFYPIFLLAGLTLLIPILIHLFNLRRYKTVFFSHTRLLKNLQLHSQKQAQVKYKLLLALRLLFLICLILAFAQPYWSNSNKMSQQTAINVFYIDNSQSMSLRNGQKSLFESAKENALKLIAASSGKFLILSNDAPYSYHTINKLQAISAIQQLPLSTQQKTSTQVLSELRGLLQEDAQTKAVLYYISDFQQYGFSSQLRPDLLQDIQFNGIKIQQSKVANVYIDTAYFESPMLQTEQSNRLIVRSKYYGSPPKEKSILQLYVNGIVKSAATPSFDDRDEHTDTLSFQINKPEWQRISLCLNDQQVHFDDTFLIAAKPNAALSVLWLNEGPKNIFIQAALKSYNGFNVKECAVNNPPQSVDAFNLILFNGVKNIAASWAKVLLQALQNGQNVCIFLDSHAPIAALNQDLKQLIDIDVLGLDTQAQKISQIQTEHRLIKDMFEHLPDNVQLPFSKRHISIRAGLNANQQTIFSFSNGDPFFAAYSIGKGQLFIGTSNPDPAEGNFQSSYFFVPFLYQMAHLAKGNYIYALSAGQKEPIFIDRRNEGEQNLLHLRGNGIDAIPAQKAEGMGIKIYPAALKLNSGFYNISNNQLDSNIIAVNQNRKESVLAVWSLNELEKNWSGPQIKWQETDGEHLAIQANKISTFPLWKLCTILALIILGFESYLLIRKQQNKHTITT